MGMAGVTAGLFYFKESLYKYALEIHLTLTNKQLFSIIRAWKKSEDGLLC